MESIWLREALERAKSLGFLGPGPIEEHVAHAAGFAAAYALFRPDPPGSVLDLGSGGGVPGLILGERWGTRTTLLEASQRRTEFLREVATQSGAPTGLEIVTGRAEDLARDPSLEGAFDLVVARSFGPPAVAAECGVRFLKPGALLVVSGPPAGDPTRLRWPPEPLARLALRLLGTPDVGRSFAVLERHGELDERHPRRDGVPAKRPLF